ncbi:hypothetical protein CRM22_002162 [Opisthorchis felineus]|uniref:protein-histidine N-methyltransferase n=1 Tax=Opisthorchis felineus TaxID=147828 RepID=A0A4S2M7Q2_OPIFE|nr:hypothetical protein CRM22_002162 [Opisthorchis felineus]
MFAFCRLVATTLATSIKITDLSSSSNCKSFQFGFYTSQRVGKTEEFDSSPGYITDVGKFSLADGNTDVLKLRSLTHRVGSLDLLYLCPSDLGKFLSQPQPGRTHKAEDSALESVLKSSRDVIPGVMEGGLTVWDGSKHLIAHLAAKFSPSLFCGRRVLELGCGCGLPGLTALKCGASVVTFQDYNHEVITNWTIPNVLLNLGSTLDTEALQSSVSFYSGDWVQLARRWESEGEEPYDLILTAETIYRPDLYDRLLRAVAATLNKHGSVFLMCKAAYGPGGTLCDFVEAVDANGLFRPEITEMQEDGVVKFIVQLTWK